MKQLFKYLSEPRTILSDGFIRLTQVCCLNDPFEATYSSIELERLTEYFEDSNYYCPIDGSMTYSEFLEKNIGNVGVICLTENKENLLMWAHYANEHKGLVIGITQFDESLFHHLFNINQFITNISIWKIKPPFDGRARPVNYRKSLRYRNDKFDYDYSWIDEEGGNRMLYEVMMQKSMEQIYEQEYRIVLRLEQSDRIKFVNLDRIEKIYIRKHVEELSKYDPINKSYTIDLFEIEDDFLRFSIAHELAKLSKFKDTIYMMKITPNYINCCLLGLYSEINKQNLNTTHAASFGRFEYWKANKNLEYYCLDFNEIK